MVYKIKRKGHSVPITALYISRNLILAGEGSSVCVYDLEDNKLFSRTRLFSSATVHGFSSYGDCVAVYGAKSIRVVQLNPETSNLTPLCGELTLPDWIWSVQWMYDDHHHDNSPDNISSPCRLAVVLGHNAVVLLDWMNGKVLKETHCQDKCILYSAHVIGHQWRHLVIAAGTVFNQVVLWPAAMPESDSEHSVSKVTESDPIPPSDLPVSGSIITTSEEREITESRSKIREPEGRQLIEVMHRLRGHQGVIFSITTHRQKRHLCSVSDDRSIRLWQISSANVEKPLSDWSVSNWVNAKFDLVHVLYGHTARVWSAVLLSDFIVSIGEDACCIQWTYDGQIHSRVKGHKGRSIWSLACSQDEKILVTGGGDTSIRIRQLHTKAIGSANSNSTSQMLQPCEDEKDFPRLVRLLGSDLLLSVTNTGDLRCYKTDEQQWRTLLSDARFRSYSVMETFTRGGLVAMGSIQGLVKVITADGSMCVEKQLFDGKVLSLCWLSPGDSTIQLLATGPNGDLMLVELVLAPGELCMKLVGRYFLPPTKQHWVSAACILPCCPLLVCGDRGGTVHVYDLHAIKDAETVAPPIQSLVRIHSKAGVTDVCYHDNHVLTCGRDGLCRKYQVTTRGLHMLQANKITKGWDWLGRLLQFGDDLYIMGFHMDQFVVHNLSQSECLASVSCGGGHRAWDFVLKSHEGATVRQMSRHHSPGGSIGRFTYIKNRGVVLCDIQLHEHSLVLKPALHGREMNDVRCIYPASIATHASVLATAGEDGLVNLLNWNTSDSGSRELEVISRLQGHISSVRALAVSCSNKSPDAMVLLSGGGRAQLMAWRIWRKTCSCHLIKDRLSETENKSTGFQSTEDMVKGVRNSATSDQAGSGEKFNTSVQAGSGDKFNKSVQAGAGDKFNKSVQAIAGDKFNAPVQAGSGSTSDAAFIEAGSDDRCVSLDDSCGERFHSSSDQTSQSDKADMTAENTRDCEVKFCDTGVKNKVRSIMRSEVTSEVKSEIRSNVKSESRSEVRTDLCECSCWPEQLCNHTVIRDGGTRRKKTWKSAEMIADPETRIMSLDVFRIREVDTGFHGNQHVVVAGCSDAVLRLFLFDEDSCMFRSLAHTSYHQHCILKVTHVTMATNHRALILSAGTGGSVALWDITDILYKELRLEHNLRTKSQHDRVGGNGNYKCGDSDDCNLGDDDRNHGDDDCNHGDDSCDLDGESCSHGDRDDDLDTKNFSSTTNDLDLGKPTWSKKCHQSGVNALDIRQISECRYLLVTGGDDNAIHVLLLDLLSSQGQQVKVIGSSLKTGAHSTQITGVHILADNHHGNHQIISVSIDQRVTLWRLRAETLELEHVESLVVDVADVSQLCLWREGWRDGYRALVCGVGIQGLSIDGSTPQL